MASTEAQIPDDLRAFARRCGFLTAARPEPHIHRTFKLRRSSVIVRITAGEVERNVLSSDGHTRVMEIIGDDGALLIRSGSLAGSAEGGGGDVLRRAQTVLEQLNTVSELPNLREEGQIREALDHLGWWAIQVARRDVGLPKSRAVSGADDDLVERLLNPPRG